MDRKKATALLAKLAAWGQFALVNISQAVQATQSTGKWSWLKFGSSLAVAFGVHAAANTDGGK